MWERMEEGRMTVVLVGSNKPEKDPPNEHYYLDSNHCSRLKFPRNNKKE